MSRDDLQRRCAEYLASVPNRGDVGPHHLVSDLAAELASMVPTPVLPRVDGDYPLPLLIATKRALFRFLEDPTLEDARAVLDAVAAALPAAGAVPVDQWKIVKDEQVLIFVVHDHAQYAQEAADLARWQGWCVGSWTDFNKGGWTWHGHTGLVTHVMPLPDVPAVARRL